MPSFFGELQLITDFSVVAESFFLGGHKKKKMCYRIIYLWRPLEMEVDGLKRCYAFMDSIVFTQLLIFTDGGGGKVIKIGHKCMTRKPVLWCPSFYDTAFSWNCAHAQKITSLESVSSFWREIFNKRLPRIHAPLFSLSCSFEKYLNRRSFGNYIKNYIIQLS